MRRQILVDTGPIVAFLDRRDTHHAWATEQFKRYPRPLLTCEAVCAEAAYLLQRNGLDPAYITDLLLAGALSIGLDMEAEAAALQVLLRRYSDRPMDLADACLVRMSERYPDSQVLSIDADFTIYRRNGREPIPLIAP